MERKSTAVAGPVLEVKNLSVSFRMYDRGLEQYDLKVISNLNLDVRPGEIVAVAGSSGSGKSLLAHAVMGLLPENASVEGEISYGGKLLEQKDMERLRGKEFALVPQSVTFLDPSMKVGPQVTGPRPSRERRQRQREVFDRFHLAEAVDRLYPFQLSGGMARRVLVSTAVLSGASLILADEPTPGMDLEMALEALQCFLLICAALLALKQLTETTDNVYRYGLLQKLGAGRRQIDHTLFVQTVVFFAIPLVVAGVYSAFLIGKAMAVVEEFMNIHIATNIGLTIVLFLLVYGSYFLATYLSCKRIVTEQRELEV